MRLRLPAALLATVVVVLGCSASALGPSSSPSPTGAPPSSLTPTGPTQAAEVVRVADGDTIIVAIAGQESRVRYIGMDAPESVRPNFPVEFMAREAAAANAGLVEGRRVVLEKDVSETDSFGRLLRYVWLETADGWLLVNLELVRLGFANAVTYPPDVKYTDLLRAAERDARAAGRGLWASP